jgi:flagellar basal body-associated protein FliL
MSDFIHDPMGLRPKGNDPKDGKRSMLILAVAIAVALLGLGTWFALKGGRTPAKQSAAASVDGTTVPEAAPKAVPEPVMTAEQKAEEEAEEDARVRTEVLAERVRTDMCDDYGKRYVEADTGVKLVRAVQLSQAAGCGWNHILHASVASQDTETLDALSRKIDEIDRKTDQIRWRSR